jgi:energy-coupling factor transporter transmembrane protein EcfT
VELPVAVALAVVVALVTLVLCDLAGGIARAKGRSYWLFFAFGLLLWFPALLVALALKDERGSAVTGPRGLETALGTLILVAGAGAAALGVAAALAYAP